MIKKIKHIVFWIGILIPVFSVAQKNVAETILKESEKIQFQTSFFDALQQKAIGNYEKAISYLEICNNLDKKNKAVLFELSKNYLLLSKYPESEYYIVESLEIEPANLYLLRHLKEIKIQQNDHKGVIEVQQKIIEIKPLEEADLVVLFLKSGEINKAITLIKKLDKENSLPSHLVTLKQTLVPSTVVDNPTDPFAEKQKMEKPVLLKNNYAALKKELENEIEAKQYEKLLENSNKAIALYPAQAFVYLANGIALNNLQQYEKAKNMLELGLDYLIDNTTEEIEFMEQLSFSYNKLGDKKAAMAYSKKALNLRKK